MKRPTARNRALTLTSAFCLIVAPTLKAQTASPSSDAGSSDEESIVLSPFVVDASADQNGYRANSTLAGTRVRTDLKDLASSISVVTQQFLNDTGAKNNADLLVYTPSTEVGGIRGNFSGGQAGNPIYQENTVSTTTRVRGLDSADNTRDYFLTDIPWDGFNVGRIDLQRGPNSILFGTGSPSGIINASVDDAAFKNNYHFENRFDQYGSFRNQLMVNQELVKGVLAVRLAALKDDEKFEQKPAFNNTTRYYAAVRFDPKIFGEDNHTSIRAKYEDGKVRSNNPRQLPPNDTITPWFKTGADAYGNPGFNKLTINQFNTHSPLPAGFTTVAAYDNGDNHIPAGSNFLPGGTGGPLTGSTYALGSNQGRSYWPDIFNYYEATPRSDNNLANTVDPSGTPIKTIVATPNTGKAVGMGQTYGDSGNALRGLFPGWLPKAIPLYSQYAYNVHNNGFGNAAYPGSPIPGGVYYADVVLTDSSVYNFYTRLMDGPNKKEWQDWKAFNLALEQGLFNDRLYLQAVFDHQDYTSGTNGWLQGQQYAINVDVNETYADGSPNPNVGRPYVSTGSGAPGMNQEFNTIRDSFRFTTNYEFRASDFLGETTAAKIIGRHQFTGSFEKTTFNQTAMSWTQYATTPEYRTTNYPYNAAASKSLNAERQFEWLAYIGPNMSSLSSASGLNLENVNYTIKPPTEQTFWNFDSTWNKPLDTSDPNYVNPSAPYIYTDYNTGAHVTGREVDNPANYVGWKYDTVKWLSQDNPQQFPDLITSASRIRKRDTAQAITWQGYMFDNDLVVTAGWRKDRVSSLQSNAYTDPNTGFTSLDYPDNQDSRTDISGISKTWGAVYHLPKFITQHLPWDSTISVFFNKGQNFKADAARLDLSGRAIPNATGNTTEYGVTITTLNDKLSLKIARFKTKVANATLAETNGNSIAGLGANGYVVANGSQWGWGWATALQDGLDGNTPGTNYWDYANADGLPNNTPAEKAAYDAYNHNGGTFNGHVYSGGDAVVNAWLNSPYPDEFFKSYAQSPDIIPSLARASGKLRDAYPAGYDDRSSQPLGGGSSFGNHQTTVDNLSEGTEIELNYQPLKNWNIAATYSKVHATHTAIDPVSLGFIADMTQWLNGPAGEVRMWYNGGPKLGDTWNSSIVAPYAVEVNQLGHEAPEVSPWRASLVSTYTFDRGILKGLFVGGAFRDEAGRILGYHYVAGLKNAITDDPRFSAVKILTQGGLDVNQVFRGEDEHHVDLWIGYNKKLTHNIDWRIQLNVRSIGENDRLIASRINPDGNIALARIVQGMGWQLTNSFDF